MVGDDLQRVMLHIFHLQQLRRRLDDDLEQVDVVVIVYLLHYGSNTLQTHSGVDRRVRKRVQFPALVAVVLHEHQIPDFNEAIQVLALTARRASRNIFAMIIEDFATGATGTGIAHLPKIILVKA